MGGKTSNTNEDIVNLEAEQAEDARLKEEERQQRIDQGLAAISQAFEGTPVMGYSGSNFSWDNFDPTGATAGGQVAGLPAGYSYYQAPGTTTSGTTPEAEAAAAAEAAYKPAASSHDAGLSAAASGSDTRTSGNDNYVNDGTTPTTDPVAATTVPGAWGIMGPDGQIYNSGDIVKATGSYDTGKTTGGFDQKFYDDYKQGILDYYMPQVETKYADAKDEATYRLARAGTLQSSMANETTADLAEQNDLNRADVQNQSDTAAADLSTRVASERSKAESQLYATEDPEIAASQALAAVTNLSLEEPELTPLGEIFKIATIGSANAINGYKTQSYIDQIRNGDKGTVVI